VAIYTVLGTTLVQYLKTSFSLIKAVVGPRFWVARQTAVGRVNSVVSIGPTPTRLKMSIQCVKTTL